MSSVQFGNIGGSVTVQGDLTAGDKIVGRLQAEQNLSEDQAADVGTLLDTLITERQQAEPDKSTMTQMVMGLARYGLPLLSKAVVELLLRR